MTHLDGALERAASFGLVHTDDAERCLGAINSLAFLATQVRRIRAQLEAQVVEWLEENPGKLPEYYVAKSKRYKPHNVPEVAEAVITQCQGDLEVFSKTLSANPFKRGEVRELLGAELTDELFETLYSKKATMHKKSLPATRQIDKPSNKQESANG